MQRNVKTKLGFFNVESSMSWVIMVRQKQNIQDNESKYTTVFTTTIMTTELVIGA